MHGPYRFAVEHEPDPRDLAVLEERLAAAAVAAVGTEEREFGIFVRETGSIVAGVAGAILGGGCQIHTLWVDDEHRGRGLAHALLEAAESEAQRQGCRVVMGLTYDALTAGFYEPLGYRTIGVIEDCPAGTTTRWYHKELDRDRERNETMTATIDHPALDERAARGKAARANVPIASHEAWEPAAGRPDPVALLEEQNTTREPDLVPVRHGRMMVSPFTFYRGAAKIMAEDLARTPTAGLDVQLCGDAHLSNFGVYASPERTLVFDLNDFDETLPGPFEYDVKRMAASFTIAARNNGFKDSDARGATFASVAAYRQAMADFAKMNTLDIWYARLSEAELMRSIKQATRALERSGDAQGKTARKAAQKSAEKAHTRDSLQALSKLGERIDGKYRIVSQPPVVIPLRELAPMTGRSVEEMESLIHEQFRAYRATLQDDRRRLLERFQIVDMARKVVGVGSVGTRAFIILLQGRDKGDPLFLQVKEATESVLEHHLPKSEYAEPGERVVQGQRMMQAASDMFLGWTRGVDTGRHLYWRQLRDMKGSAVVDTMGPPELAFYARLCGRTLARAHARSGDPVAIAAYLGKKDRFDRAITDFAMRYADQNERDYQAFTEAIRSRRLEALEGV